MGVDENAAAAAPAPLPGEADDAGESRSARWTWRLAAAMACTAVAVTAPGWFEDPRAAVPGVTWLALLPLFALAEVGVIHLPTQRNAHGHTLREIPAVLGLIFLAPQAYVTAYVAGAVLALLVAARMRGVKLAFNSAMFALEAALGALVYHALLLGHDPLSPSGWLAVLAAVLTTDLFSAAAVTAAISLTEGVFDGEVLQEALRSGSVAAFINTCVALLVATLVLVRPEALVLLGVMVALLVLGYRVYISLARGHAQTQLLYRFVDRTSSAQTTTEVVEVVLSETAELMHAEHAFLVEVVDAEHARIHTATGSEECTAAWVALAADTWWWAALHQGVVRHASRSGPPEDAQTDDASYLASAPRDGLAARLRVAGSSRYVLVVRDRTFEKETFSSEDQQVFEALAAHAGVALERAQSLSDLEAVAAELEVARDVALAASEAKSLFLANVSHEIRTPLTIMLATSEIFEDTSLDQLQQNLLERMQRAGGRLQSLVEQILDYARIESGDAQIAHAPYDVRTLLTEATDDLALRTAGTETVVDCELDPDLPCRVVGDAVRVRQVLDNLLDNAVKFTHEGRVTLSATVRGAGGADRARWLELVVSDTGIGIAPEDQGSIFEVFSQVDATATRHYEGTGLGLASCRQLTELMGGTVTVESAVGVGSVFTVRLPLEVAPAASDAGEVDPGTVAISA